MLNGINKSLKTIAFIGAVSAASIITPTTAVAAADPLLGEIMMVGFNFCPRGWASAEGQLLPIAQNTALFSLLGTIYGGDGRTTFALPDLRGRTAIGVGTGAGLSARSEGQRTGTETNAAQLVSHNHSLMAVKDIANKAGPIGGYLAKRTSPNDSVYSRTKDIIRPMASDVISQAGTIAAGTAVNNMQPSLVIRHCIALQGIYPSRS